MADANIRAVITAKDEASGVLGRFSNSLGLGVAAAATAAATAVAGFAVTSVKAFSESEDLIAQTNAVLKSTGGVAGETADSITKLSKSLEAHTTYSDEDVRSVENLLLTFTKINKDVFPQTTATVLDMATAMHEDLKTASIQVGKAMQDPVLGMTALRRVGVAFSKDQIDVVKHLVDTGQSAKAQQMILKELNTEFGGSAAAATKTFSGQLKQLKNNFNDAQEGVGYFLVKGLNPLVAHLNAFVQSEKFSKFLKDAENDAVIFGRGLEDLYKKFLDVWRAVASYLEPKLHDLAKAVEGMMPTIDTFVKTFLLPMAKAFGRVAGEGLVGAIGLVIDTATFLLNNVFKPLMDFMDSHKTIVYILAGAFLAVRASMIINDTVAAFQAGLTAVNTGIITTTISRLGELQAAFIAAFPFAVILAAAGAFAVGIINIMNQIHAAMTKTAQANITADVSQNKLFLAQAQQIVNTTKDPATRARAQAQVDALHKQGYAMGTNFAPGGVALVGERGPEYVDLPRGSKVIPNGRGSSGGVVNINLNAQAFMGSAVEARKYAQLIVDHVKDIASAKNMTASQLLGGS